MTADLRLFFALWPDAKARAALARLAGEVAHHTQGRAPRAEGLHVTLAFLGAVPPARMPAVAAAGERAARAVDPFPIALSRVGGTGYGIAWLAPETMPAPLREVYEALAGELEARGFPREKRMFRPHITLARDGVRRPQLGSLPPVEWTVERLALVASTLAPGGSHYRDVATWPLRRA